MKAAGDPFPTQSAAKMNGVRGAHSLNDWRPLKLFFIFAILAGAGDQYRFKGPDVDTARDPEIEDELFLKFVYRREVSNLKVSGKWLKREMRKLVRHHRPRGWEHYSYSNGWLSRFCIRYNISSQMRSNKKHLDIAHRIPAIQTFHRFMHDLRNSGVDRDEKYGRFAGNAYFHMDQNTRPS